MEETAKVDFGGLTMLSAGLASCLAEENADSNLVFSPLSIYAALALLAAGARGATLDEILRVAGAQSRRELEEVLARVAGHALKDQSDTGGPRRVRVRHLERAYLPAETSLPRVRGGHLQGRGQQRRLHQRSGGSASPDQRVGGAVHAQSDRFRPRSGIDHAAHPRRARQRHILQGQVGRALPREEHAEQAFLPARRRHRRRRAIHAELGLPVHRRARRVQGAQTPVPDGTSTRSCECVI